MTYHFSSVKVNQVTTCGLETLHDLSLIKTLHFKKRLVSLAWTILNGNLQHLLNKLLNAFNIVFHRIVVTFRYKKKMFVSKSKRANVTGLFEETQTYTLLLSNFISTSTKS